MPRLTALIRGARRPAAHAIGDWNVTDVALHVAHAWETLPRLSRSEISAPLRDVMELSGLTTALVAGEAERDLGAIAARIDSAVAAFLAATPADGAAEGVWLVQGVHFPAAVIHCHLLNEALVHGDDIATAERVPWQIAREHAALAIMGFVLPVLATLDPRALVDQEAAAGLRATYEISLRGRGRAVLAFDDGRVTVDPSPAGRVDCHIAADPVAFLLVMWGRRSQWSAIGRGQMVAWGRRAWLAPRLRSLMRNP